MLKILKNESSAEVFESFLNDYNHFRGMKLSSSYSLFKDVFREQRVISGFKRKELEELFDESKELPLDRKSTRLNSSHVAISYAVFCLKKKKKKNNNTIT